MANMFMVMKGLFYFSADPVKMFEHSSDTQDSLLKFMGDIFSSPTTCELFYSNDMKVLIDIIVRQISDLMPGDQVNTPSPCPPPPPIIHTHTHTHTMNTPSLAVGRINQISKNNSSFFNPFILIIHKYAYITNRR